MSPDARDEIEVAELPGASAGCLVSPCQMPGGHLRARLKLALLLPQRMRQQESDRIGAAPLRERQDDGLLFGPVGQLDLESATADGLIAAESGERQFDRRPLGQTALAIQPAVERPFPQVDPLAPLAAFHIDGLGRQIPVLDVDEAAQRDAELPGRRGDDLQAEEHVGPPTGRGRDAQCNANCQAEREDRFHGESLPPLPGFRSTDRFFQAGRSASDYCGTPAFCPHCFAWSQDRVSRIMHSDPTVHNYIHYWA